VSAAGPGGFLAGERIAFLTQHGKESVVAPRFREAFGAIVERVHGFDTDRLGTFTRDIPRAGAQLDAARSKARLGMRLSGLPRGLASEGAFGPDPVTGLVPWNVELLVFIDDGLGVEVPAWAGGPAWHHHRTVTSDAELDRFCEEAGFPEHHLVVRPDDENDPRITKGIRTREELRAAFHWAKAASKHGAVFVETDFRAHANPTRMRMIAAAADELVGRLRTACPRCACPGFGVAGRIPGLPCSWCGAPTRIPKAVKRACPRCHHEELSHEPAAARADPGSCDDCNP